jgi:hypothetical protein
MLVIGRSDETGQVIGALRTLGIVPMTCST